MRNTIYTLVLAGAAASQLGSTDCGQALRDPGFDLWCGDSLCAWTVERGDVQRVPTWNEGDPGVSLVGDDAAIAQLSPVAWTDGSCLEFDLIADVDPSVDVELNIDVFGDGSVEHSERIPASHWKSLSFQLPIAGVYDGIRFELAKTGSGRAVLANIGAKIVSDGCQGLTPIVPAPAPDGAPCLDDAGCTSGRCGNGATVFDECIGCVVGSCPSGDVCGLGDPTSPVRSIPIECVAAGSRELGDNCLYDAECASNICTDGACSTCRTDGTGCLGGQACGPAWSAPDGFVGQFHTPYVCAPDAHARQKGEPCASDDDCASDTCDGTPRLQCDDGRACTSAADCPFGGDDTGNGLQNGPCNDVGVQGGTCS